MRLGRPLAIIGLASAFLLLSPGSPASAHAYLSGSAPGDGASVEHSPHQLALHFSESVVIGATRIDVVDAAGRHYTPTNLRLLGGDGASTEDPTSVVATLPDLPRDAYRVSWETLSSDDLHRTSGVLVFGVAKPVSATAPDEPLPQLDEAALRWLVFLSLALALGGAFAARLFRRRDPLATAVHRCERWSIAGALTGVVVAAGLLIEQLAGTGGAWRTLLFGSYGQRWMLREAGFVLLLVAALASRKGLSRLNSLRVLGAVACCVGSALLGHSAATQALSVTRVGADAAHLASAGVWSGTLLVLTVVGVPMLRRDAVAAAGARRILRDFGVPATACVGVMVVTGLYLSSHVVGSIDAALMTFYGRALILKVVLAALAGALGLGHAWRLRRGPARYAPRASLRWEAAAAVAVLLLAGVLTSAQPATEPALVSKPAVVTVPVVDGQAADLQETVTVRPNRAGANVAVVSVFDTRRPSPGPITGVDVRFLRRDGGSPVSAAAEALGDGRWSVPVQLAASGPMQIEVTAHRVGSAAAVGTYQWTVGDAVGRATGTSKAPFSRTPIGGYLRWTAAVLASLLLILFAIGGFLRRISRRARFARSTGGHDGLPAAPSGGEKSDRASRLDADFLGAL